MRAVIEPARLSGSVEAPSSKSEAHRLLICAALASGTTNVDCTTTSDDIDATISCLEALGAGVARTRRGFRVTPVPVADGPASGRGAAELDCGESGSTLRFLLPVVAALGRGASITAHGRLPQRPLSPLYEELVSHGAEISPQGEVPLRVSGRLRPGRFSLPGNVSSQYVSGLLLAAPLMGEPVEVVVTEPVESRPYIDITVAALRRFGAEVTETRFQAPDGTPARTFVCSAPGGLVSPGTVRVGGDWSNAAFWLAAGAVCGREQGVAVTGLDARSPQGDRQVLAALALLGARVLRSADGAGCVTDRLVGRTIDVSACPDLVPPLAAVAAVAEGTTTFTGAARLRLKESDRLETVSAAIRALGGRARATEDGLLVEGVPELAGGVVDAANDHRIAMMAAVLSTRCAGTVSIDGAECVSKSYPAFFEDFASLGGHVLA